MTFAAVARIHRLLRLIQLTAAEAKAIRLEQELYGANVKIMEAQREQLAAVRASREAHAATLQSKQFDRGKDVRVNS